MNDKIIRKIERTDADVDNSLYEVITYTEVVDDEGTVHYIGKRKEVPCASYEHELNFQKQLLEVKINQIQDTIKIQEQVAEKQAELAKIEERISSLGKVEVKDDIKNSIMSQV